MNLDRFKEFVETKSIFFPKAQTFLKDDLLECAVSIRSNKNWLSNLRTIAYPTFDNELDGLSEEEKKQKVELKKQEEIADNKDFRDKVLISCWHANDYESAAMWKLYKGDRYYRTVAISISMCNLRNALPKPIHIGEVEYVDYEKVYPTKIRAFKKRVSYEHEKEIRAVIFPEHIENDKIKDTLVKEKENGLLIKLAEKYLEFKVYISPWSSQKFKKDVRKFIENSDWNKKDEPNPSLRIIPSEYAPIY
jgi:O-phosphoseryl-tRNA(Cys) synthetase